MAEIERNIALSRIVDLEKELEFVKESNKDLKKKYNDLESAGVQHDREMTDLLNPVAKGLSCNQSDSPWLILSFLLCPVAFLQLIPSHLGL